MSIVADPEALASVPTPSGSQQALYLDSTTNAWTTKTSAGTGTTIGGVAITSSDITVGGTSTAPTLALNTVNTNTGTFGSGTSVPVITVNGKGLLTSVSSAAITAAGLGAATGTGSANGTNTGDVTLTAVGSTPNANGASLSGQALTLQPANANFPGVMTAAQAAKLLGLPGNWYDVTNYGMATGNTAAANTSALNTLLAGAASGSVIYFPIGLFPVNANITVPGKVFYFVGSASGNATPQSGLQWTSNVAGDLITLTATNPFTQFRDMTFTTTVAQTAGAVVNVNGNSNINFYGCAFQGGSTSNTLFNGINFTGTSGGQNSLVFNCYFSLFSGTGIIVNSTAATPTLIGGVINGALAGTTQATAGINTILAASLTVDNTDIVNCTNNFLSNPTTGTTVGLCWFTTSSLDNSNGASVKITGAGATLRTKFVGCSMSLSSVASGVGAVEYSSTYTNAAGVGLDFNLCNILNLFATAGTLTGFSLTTAPDFHIIACNIAGWATGISVTPAALAGMCKSHIMGNRFAANSGVSACVTGIVLNVGTVAYGSVLIEGNGMAGVTTPLTDNAGLGTGTSATGVKVIANNTGVVSARPMNVAATAIPLTTVTNVDSLGGLLIPPAPRPTKVRITVRATNAATAQTLTATIRFGTNNSNADTAVLTQAFTAGTAAVGSGIFIFEVDFLSTTTLDAAVRFYNGNNAATGIVGAATLIAALTAPATITTTANSWLGVYFSSATAAAITIRSVTYEVVSQ